MVSFKKDGKLRLGGETLDADSILGNENFFKTVEGFMESLPQSTYQLSIMMRTPWHEISKNKSSIKFMKLHNCLKNINIISQIQTKSDLLDVSFAIFSQISSDQTHRMLMQPEAQQPVVRICSFDEPDHILQVRCP